MASCCSTRHGADAVRTANNASRRARRLSAQATRQATRLANANVAAGRVPKPSKPRPDPCKCGKVKPAQKIRLP